jgi:hypothetical protein
MGHRLQTQEGKKRYALRKQIPEPVFGIIKSVLGFRQFLLRGLDNVRGEWNLVTMAWNIKRMFALAGANRRMTSTGLGGKGARGRSVLTRGTRTSPRRPPTQRISTMPSRAA